jgi:3-oxoacyl-[acyl-carrier protein] reductase
MTRVLGRQRAGAQQQPAHSPAPARRQPSPQPAYYGRANRPAPAPSPTPAPAFAQSPVYQQSPAPVQQRVVARAAVGDAGFNGGSPATATEVAVVTGAGAGLGRAIALGLAAAGYGIIAVDQDLGGAAAASTQIQGYGVRALPLAADLRDARSLDSIVAVAAEWGGPAVLVNSVADATGTPALDLASAMLLSQLMLDPMRGRGGGAIVNIAPDTAALARYTAGLAGPASSFGVRAMGVGAAGSAHPADVVAAVLTLVRQGTAGSVTEL